MKQEYELTIKTEKGNKVKEYNFTCKKILDCVRIINTFRPHYKSEIPFDWHIKEKGCLF